MDRRSKPLPLIACRLAAAVAGICGAASLFMAAAAEATDYAEAQHAGDWLRHPVYGDPSFDAFERLPVNPIHRGVPPYESVLVWGCTACFQASEGYIVENTNRLDQPAMSEMTQALCAATRGEAGAAQDLLPLVYDELRRLAGARMAQEGPGQTLQATALVHEAWLRLVNEGHGTWANRALFFSAAAEAMRRILIENVRRKSRLKRGGGQLIRVEFSDVDLAERAPDDRVLLIDEALERLKTENPEAAQLVLMKFFAGMTNQEVAETLGVTERTVERRWAFAKAWLLRNIEEAR